MLSVRMLSAMLFLSGHGECGDGGCAAGSAVGMQSLPRNIPVEIEATVQLDDGP